MNKRNNIEAKLIRLLIRRDSKYEIASIPRNVHGKMLTYSPYEANLRTSLDIDNNLMYDYKILSIAVHNSTISERNIVEDELYKLIPTLKYGLIHLSINQIKSKTDYIGEIDKCRAENLYNLHNLSIPSYDTYSYFKSLVCKWRSLSANEHYKLSKQEKRKLKKLEVKSMSIDNIVILLNRLIDIHQYYGRDVSIEYKNMMGVLSKAITDKIATTKDKNTIADLIDLLEYYEYWL